MFFNWTGYYWPSISKANQMADSVCKKVKCGNNVVELQQVKCLFIWTVALCSTVPTRITWTTESNQQFSQLVHSSRLVGSTRSADECLGEKATSKCCLESERSSCLLLRLLAVWHRGETVVMPQVLRQAVEERSDVGQAIADLPTWAHHWQARRLLESSHFLLSHITVHIKVKSKNEVKESLVLIAASNERFCWF